MGEEKAVVQLGCYSVQGSQPASVPDPEGKNGWTFLQISLTSGASYLHVKPGTAVHTTNVSPLEAEAGKWSSRSTWATL